MVDHRVEDCRFFNYQPIPFSVIKKHKAQKIKRMRAFKRQDKRRPFNSLLLKKICSQYQFEFLLTYADDMSFQSLIEIYNLPEQEEEPPENNILMNRSVPEEREVKGTSAPEGDNLDYKESLSRSPRHKRIPSRLNLLDPMPQGIQRHSSKKEIRQPINKLKTLESDEQGKYPIQSKPSTVPSELPPSNMKQKVNNRMESNLYGSSTSYYRQGSQRRPLGRLKDNSLFFNPFIQMDTLKSFRFYFPENNIERVLENFFRNKRRKRFIVKNT
jgi:hypothetical protein